MPSKHRALQAPARLDIARVEAVAGPAAGRRDMPRCRVSISRPERLQQGCRCWPACQRSASSTRAPTGRSAPHRLHRAVRQPPAKRPSAVGPRPGRWAPTVGVEPRLDVRQPHALHLAGHIHQIAATDRLVDQVARYADELRRLPDGQRNIAHGSRFQLVRSRSRRCSGHSVTAAGAPSNRSNDPITLQDRRSGRSRETSSVRGVHRCTADHGDDDDGERGPGRPSRDPRPGARRRGGKLSRVTAARSRWSCGRTRSERAAPMRLLPPSSASGMSLPVAGIDDSKRGRR